MFVRLGKICVVLALVTSLGAHWALLQTVAWTTMLADNLQSGSFHDAVTKTFDGNHPCPICQAIAAAKKSEQKSSFPMVMKRVEYPPFSPCLLIFAPARYDLLRTINLYSDATAWRPPTPPPRALPV